MKYCTNLHQKIDCFTETIDFEIKKSIPSIKNRVKILINPINDYQYITETVPKIELINYILFMMCTFSFWLGLSFLDMLCISMKIFEIIPKIKKYKIP